MGNRLGRPHLRDVGVQLGIDPRASCRPGSSRRPDGGLDVTYNYDRVTLPGAASAGWSDGTGTGDGFRVFDGGGVAGAYDDANVETGLVHHSVNSDQPGRYSFHFMGFKPKARAPKVQRHPSISGDLWTGGTVTVDPGTWALDGELASGLTHTYSWSCWTPTGSIVLPSSATVSLPENCSYGFVQVTATKPGHETASYSTSFYPRVGPPAATSTGAPVIGSDSPTVGQVLTTSTGEWDVAGGSSDDLTFTTQWWRNGRRLVGVGDSYTVRPADGTHMLAARVTASRPGHEPVTTRSAGVRVLETTSLTQVTEPSIAGIPQVGQTITRCTRDGCSSGRCPRVRLRLARCGCRTRCRSRSQRPADAQAGRHERLRDRARHRVR